MVSVCMATFNGEQYIKEQVDSILGQLGPDDELVVSDDHSTDGTVAVLKAFGDQRIRVVFNTPNKGKVRRHQLITRNFFNAIGNSRGDVIFLADQDDVWMPSKVQLCMKELECCDLVIHNAERCGQDMKSMNKTMWPDGFKFHNYLVFPHSYMGCCMAFRRSMLEWILPPPISLSVHDYWIGIVCELSGRVRYIPQPLIKYRLHGDNNSLHSDSTLIRKITYRVYIIWQYSLRYLKFRLNSRKK